MASNSKQATEAQKRAIAQAMQHQDRFTTSYQGSFAAPGKTQARPQTTTGARAYSQAPNALSRKQQEDKMAAAAMNPDQRNATRAKADQMLRSAPRKFGAMSGVESQKNLASSGAFGSDLNACKCPAPVDGKATLHRSRAFATWR